MTNINYDQNKKKINIILFLFEKKLFTANHNGIVAKDPSVPGMCINPIPKKVAKK